VTVEQRRAVWGLCLIIAATFLAGASLTFMLAPMIADLGMTSAQGDLLLSVTGIASLLIVFASGRLGDRLGHRRVIIGAAMPLAAGAVLVAVSQHGYVALVGMVPVAAAATMIQIVALGLLQQLFPDGRTRVTAFTSFGMMFPVVWLVMPVVTGRVVGVTTWRVIPSAWAVAAALIPLVAVLLLRRPEPRKPLGELATPLLAGLALASVAVKVNRSSEGGWTLQPTAPSLLVGAAALVVLIVLLRRLKQPSLSLAPLRIRGMLPLMVGVLILACVVTLVFVTLCVQYLHSLTSLQAAVAMVPAQVGAIIGAKWLAGLLMNRLGAARAGLVSLVGFAISMLALLLPQASSPIWVPVAAATAFSLMGFAALTVLNTRVMALAPEGEQGAVSAFRGAASAIGGSLSAVVLGTGVVAAVQQQATSGAVDSAALVSSLHSDAVVGCALALVACGAYVWSERRGRPELERAAG